jgi:hypothetical protein
VAFGAQNDLSLEQSLRRRPADVLTITTFEKSDESQVRLRRQWQSRKIKSSRQHPLASRPRTSLASEPPGQALAPAWQPQKQQRRCESLRRMGGRAWVGRGQLNCRFGCMAASLSVLAGGYGVASDTHETFRFLACAIPTRSLVRSSLLLQAHREITELPPTSGITADHDGGCARGGCHSKQSCNARHAILPCGPS